MAYKITNLKDKQQIKKRYMQPSRWWMYFWVGGLRCLCGCTLSETGEFSCSDEVSSSRDPWSGTSLVLIGTPHKPLKSYKVIIISPTGKWNMRVLGLQRSIRSKIRPALIMRSVICDIWYNPSLLNVRQGSSCVAL